MNMRNIFLLFLVMTHPSWVYSSSEDPIENQKQVRFSNDTKLHDGGLRYGYSTGRVKKVIVMQDENDSNHFPFSIKNNDKYTSRRIDQSHLLQWNIEREQAFYRDSFNCAALIPKDEKVLKTKNV